MGRSSLLLCVLLCCSVWMVKGKYAAIDDGPQDQDEVKAERKLPGICWACKWALSKVRKTLGNDTKVQIIESQLLSICNQIGLLKSRCQKFMKKHLQELVEELTTTDDVRTICVNVRACKPKEATMEAYFPEDEDEVLSTRRRGRTAIIQIKL